MIVCQTDKSVCLGDIFVMKLDSNGNLQPKGKKSKK